MPTSPAHDPGCDRLSELTQGVRLVNRASSAQSERELHFPVARPGCRAPPAATQPATMPVSQADLANAIRALAMDAVEQAKSGHPGMPMGMADVATVLWTKFLK